MVLIFWFLYQTHEHFNFFFNFSLQSLLELFKLTNVNNDVFKDIYQFFIVDISFLKLPETFLNFKFFLSLRFVNCLKLIVPENHLRPGIWGRIINHCFLDQTSFIEAGNIKPDIILSFEILPIRWIVIPILNHLIQIQISIHTLTMEYFQSGLFICSFHQNGIHYDLFGRNFPKSLCIRCDLDFGAPN